MKRETPLKAYVLLLIFFSFFTASSGIVFAKPNIDKNNGYVAKNESVRGFFEALSSRIKKPIIVSKEASRKKISGEFKLDNPQAMLESMSHRVGLIWYYDGDAIYVYDNTETKSAVITLRNTSVAVVNNHLRKSGLLDKGFPLRGESYGNTFYISGPPIYVDIVKKSAEYLDFKVDEDKSFEKVAVISLENTFSEDRTFKLRGEDVVIPGVATVLTNLLSENSKNTYLNINPDISERLEKPLISSYTEGNGSSKHSKEPKFGARGVNGLKVVSDPGNNSVIIKGNAQEIMFAKNIIAALDVPKRHIELSLWIIDMQKEAIEQIGVNWSGSVNVGNNLGVTFNTSALNADKFLASVYALSTNKKANVVSRPIILTQENVPAIFDNNTTFYTQLIGERSVELEKVTYGTLVSVLPRFTAGDEIEMMLNIEDGNDKTESGDSDSTNSGLPKVGRTSISTIARVGRNKSLLIGGYSLGEKRDTEQKIPWLGDIPWIGGLFRYESTSNKNMVRVFLIQPREIEQPLGPDAYDISPQIMNDINDMSPEQLQDWVSNYMDSLTWQ